jgi:arylsulfatase
MPILSGSAESVRTDKDWLAWEMFGNRAVRQGDWKVLSLLKSAGGTGEWQLFNLRSDPGETRDLAKDNPAKVTEMAALWDEYAKVNGVIFTRDGPFERPH